MSRPRVLRDYPSQVRVFALLLILCLVILLTGATYLYGRAKGHLDRELEERLQRAADIAMARLGVGSWSVAAPQLREIPEETGVSRLLLVEVDGRESVIGSGPSPRPPRAAIDSARAGRTLFTGFYGNRREGYYRALLVSVPGADGTGRRVIGVEARSDFLGALARIRWLIIVGYTSGLALALALAALFIRSVLRPYAALTSAARTLRRAEGEAADEGMVDIGFVVSTFQQATDALRQKEAELSRLYAAERTRAETLERYQQAILGSLSSAVISFKPDLRIAVFNKTAGQIFGIDPAEAIGKSCVEVFGEGAEITAVAEEALRAGRIFSRLELAVRRRDGAVRRVGLSSSLLKDADGALVGLALMLTDLTEILQFQEQAAMRDSLAALGQMSAGIAHELRNSLGVIAGYAKLLQRTLPADDASRTYLQEILSEITLLEATLRDFLAFARPAQFARVPVPVGGLIGETLEGFRQALGDGKVKPRIDLPQEALVVLGDANALRQALGNLIRNAIEAMPNGGELAVRARGRTFERGEPAAAQPAVVEIVVEDTGPGIPQDDLGRIFTPFFTRKAGGTGLGLALVQKTVVALGGGVSVENREGGGARFTIRLPAAQGRDQGEAGKG